MPPATMTQEILTMDDVKGLAEYLAKQLLDQMRIDHAEAAQSNEKFRQELSVRVAEIQTTVAVQCARTQACEIACEKRILTTEATVARLDAEQRSVSGRIIGLLLGLLGSAGAAIWGLMRDK